MVKAEKGIMGKAGLAVMSAALALSCSPAAMAFATDASASATHGAAGSTDVYIQIKADPDLEKSVSDTNLTFKIPTEVDFVALADGTLEGPNCQIDNESIFGIHATAMTSVFDTDTTNGAWTDMTLADVASADNTKRNAVGFTIGPDTDKLDAHDHAVTRDTTHSTAGNVGVATAWNMKADGTAGDADMVKMKTTGKVKNVDKAIWDKTKLCTLTWYVKPGQAS